MSSTEAVTTPEAPSDATKDLSEEIPVKDAFMVALAAGLGYGFDAYAVNIYGLVLPSISLTLGIGSGTAGLIGSIFLVGYTIGTIGFGIAADKYGRKDTLGVSILVYGVTTMLGGVWTNPIWFTFMRFLTGVGGAGELAVGAPYTAEMFRSKYRALGVGGIMFSLYSLGYILAGVVALIVVPRWGWQWAFIFAIVPSIALWVFRRFIQESVRYVIDKTEDKFAAAQAIQTAEHQGGSATERVDAVHRIQEEQKEAEGPKKRVWDIPGVRRRIGVGWLIYTANAMGYWGITVFLTTFMVEKFDVSPAQAIQYAIGFYVVQFFFSYLGTGLSDWLGRRPIGILGAVIMIVCTVLAATASSLSVFLVFGAIEIAMLGWLWGISDTYLSEMFPTRIRATCFGIAVGGGRVMSIAAPTLTGAGIAAYGPTTPFLLSAGLWVLTIIGYLLGPETSGKSLEQIEIELDAEAGRVQPA